MKIGIVLEGFDIARSTLRRPDATLRRPDAFAAVAVRRQGDGATAIPWRGARRQDAAAARVRRGGTLQQRGRDGEAAAQQSAARRGTRRRLDGNTAAARRGGKRRWQEDPAAFKHCGDLTENVARSFRSIFSGFRRLSDFRWMVST